MTEKDLMMRPASRGGGVRAVKRFLLQYDDRAERPVSEVLGKGGGVVQRTNEGPEADRLAGHSVRLTAGRDLPPLTQEGQK